MKYFKNAEGVIFGYTEDQLHLTAGLIEIKEDEAMAFSKNHTSQANAFSCTPAQGLVALFALKKITEDDVKEAINKITDDVQRYTVHIAFNRAITWERNSLSMQTLSVLLGLTDEDLDNLFAYAVGVAT